MNKKRADEFLKYLRDILVQNNDVHLSTNNVYSQLINIGIGNDKNTYIDYLFDSWINRFKYVNNINVFVDKKWDYFCQFTNKPEETITQNNHLKLYVPLDSKYIEYGAQMIFDFLSRNNITHVSKIGKKIRFDDIVIRLINEEDLTKVIEFIKNNKYIQDGLLPANPFAFNKDGLAMVCDGNLSYNMVTSNYISLYLEEKKSKNKLEEISFEDYYNFVINYYNKYFVNMNTEQIYKDFEKQFSCGYNNKKLEDLKNISELIIKSNNIKFNYDSYIKHYKSTLDDRFERKENNNEEIESIMTEIINVMTKRVGNYVMAKENIIEYFYTGREEFLTRQAGLRYMVVSCGYRDKLSEFLNKVNENIDDYIDYVYNKNIKKTDDKNTEKINLSNEQKEELLYMAMLATKNKYNMGQVTEALSRLVFEGKWNYFTNENNVRKNMIENITPEDVKFIIKRTFGYQDEQELNISDIQYYCNFTLSSRKK